MTDFDNLTKMTDAQLTAHAGTGPQPHQKVSVEVTRRLRVAARLPAP